ncbi:MAG: AAA family ATPase [Chloroflexi bacterium]|nr:AAA family ATPase [Chloroflexota bacterium]
MTTDQDLTGQDLNAGRDLDIEVGRDFVGGSVIGGDNLQAGGDIISGGNYQNAQISYNYYGIPESKIADKEPAPTTQPPPYKGMQPYQVSEAHLFFGREAITATAVGHLRQNNFLAVVGATGMGKTSLIRAGILAALQDSHLLHDGTLPPDGSESWPVHIITPTSNPLESLAASLTRESESVTAAFTLAEDMANDSRSLALMVRRLASQAGAEHVLLVIDQLEELFGLCQSEPMREQFLANLHYAADPRQGVLVLIVGVRVAFQPLLTQRGLFGELIAQNHVLLPALNTADLRRIIEEPAQLGDENGAWEFEDNLVDFLLREAGSDLFSLPWLSHSLLEMWKRRRGRMLTFSGYTESLGIQGAILQRARALYQQLSEPDQQLARSVFMRLTELGEGTQDSRRITPLVEIMPHGPDQNPNLLKVLSLLAEARLVTVDRDGMQVVHEGLIRNWELLRQWVLENRAGLRVQRQLAADVARWRRLNQDVGSLYRGARLEQTLEWAAENPTELSPLEKEFLDVSWQTVEAERLTHEDAQRRELETAQQLAESAQRLAEAERERAEQQAQEARREQLAAQAIQKGAQWLKAISVVAVVLTILAIYAGYTALQNAAEAEEKRQVADLLTEEAEQKQRLTRARELAAISSTILYDYPQRALLLAVEAYNVLLPTDPRVPEVEEALRLALAATGGRAVPASAVANERQNVTAVAVSEDGRWLATGTLEGEILVWPQEDFTQPPLVLKHEEVGEILALAISPDGEWLYASLAGGVVLEWDLLDLETPPFVLVDDNVAYQVGLAVSENWLVLGGEDGQTTIWRRDDLGGEPIQMKNHDGSIYGVAISNDEAWLVTAGADANAYLYDLQEVVREGEAAVAQELNAHTGQIFAVAISPDNEWIVTAGGTPPWIAVDPRDAVVMVWEREDLSEPVAILTDHDAHVAAVDITADSEWLVTASWDHTARLYDLLNLDDEAYVLRGHEDHVVDVAFADGGQRIVTGSTDQTVRIWDLESAEQGLIASPLLLDNHNNPIQQMAINPTSDWLATASDDGQVWLWHLATNNPAWAQYELVQGGSRALAFSPNGRWLATAAGEGDLRLWDMSRDDPSARFVRLGGSPPAVSHLVFSADGRWLAAAGAGGIVLVWDMEALDAPPQVVRGVGLGMVQQLLFSTGTDETRQEVVDWLIVAVREEGRSFNAEIQLWPMGEWTSEASVRWTGHTDTINSMAVSPDGRWLVSGSGDRTVRRWDLFNPSAEPTVLRDYPDGVRKVAISPDGRWLAVGGWSPDLYLWDLGDLTAVPLVFRDHDAWIDDLAFSRNGEWLVSGSYDDTARLWYLESAPNIASVALRAHEDTVGVVAIRADDHWLMTGGDDGAVMVWSLQLEELVDLACRTAGRNLSNSREEWQRYFAGEVYRPTCAMWE